MGKPLQEYKVMFAKLRNAITGSKKNPRRPADEAEVDPAFSHFHLGIFQIDLFLLGGSL